MGKGNLQSEADVKFDCEDNAPQNAGKPRKLNQVIEGAHRIFLKDGFAGASVDDIARMAKVSKATLYSYFDDKNAMFEAVVRHQIISPMQSFQSLLNQNEPARSELATFAARIVHFMSVAERRQGWRLCIAEAERFPQLGQEFYDAGPGRFTADLALYLDSCVARGELQIADTSSAARQFLGMIADAPLYRSLFTEGRAPFASSQKEQVTNATNMFVDYYMNITQAAE